MKYEPHFFEYIEKTIYEAQPQIKFLLPLRLFNKLIISVIYQGFYSKSQSMAQTDMDFSLQDAINILLEYQHFSFSECGNLIRLENQPIYTRLKMLKLLQLSNLNLSQKVFVKIIGRNYKANHEKNYFDLVSDYITDDKVKKMLLESNVISYILDVVIRKKPDVYLDRLNNHYRSILKNNRDEFFKISVHAQKALFILIKMKDLWCLKNLDILSRVSNNPNNLDFFRKEKISLDRVLKKIIGLTYKNSTNYIKDEYKVNITTLKKNLKTEFWFEEMSSFLSRYIVQNYLKVNQTDFGNYIQVSAIQSLFNLKSGQHEVYFIDCLKLLFFVRFSKMDDPSSTLTGELKQIEKILKRLGGNKTLEVYFLFPEKIFENAQFILGFMDDCVKVLKENLNKESEFGIRENDEKLIKLVTILFLFGFIRHQFSNQFIPNSYLLLQRFLRDLNSTND